MPNGDGTGPLGNGCRGGRQGGGQCGCGKRNRQGGGRGQGKGLCRNQGQNANMNKTADQFNQRGKTE